ncbi:hypothetical protein PF002_g8128 [Phytophthora fragariae]|uniref:Uncharacterized protein n=1 Tax=Phytophthora fragariae TaxID=53985 RepID=A0A6A3KKI6_9STRA|nr:hypothetical protein PF009_g7612 [Phytophthora fragariae]KAE9007901.1 hypothetical protein PF011_g10925 [Phytophthora fragariae]KAE9152430.1 hypothetical protein PF006_g3342 [Phytophthora fragariae]KAE9243292.1 hypothetical protein PF004_g6210 [Phytophthora fragariae]KAE9243714.1 hypothetical protein PF002_g8128 [Phytophthora fragariae]
MPLSEESESTSRSTGSNAVVDDAQDLIAGEGSDKDGKAQITLTNVQTSKTKSQTDDNGDDKREEYGNESYGIQDHPDTDAASLNPPSITNQVRVTPTPYDNYIANGDNANAPNQNESAETQYDSPSNEAHKSNGKGKSAGAASSATGSTTGATKTIPGKSESTGKADKSNGKGKSAGSVASAGDVTDIYGGKEEATAPTELRGRSKRSSGGGGGEGDEKISTVSSGKGSSSSSTSKKQTSNTNPPSHSNEGKPGDKLTKLEAMSIATMDAATQDAKQYVRGDPTTTGIDYQDGSSIFNEGDGNSPLVIGGRKRGWQTEAQAGLYAASSSFQNGLRFSVCAAALISVLLLLAFHFEVLNEGIARYLTSGSLWAPNSWEFIVYTQYVQQIAGISALTLLKTPYFLWDFTDLFAWANFLVYHAQDEYSSNGRRLMTVILGGLVGYGDRIETDEKKLLTHTCTGFAAVIGFFLGVVLGASLWSKWRERRN